MNLIRSVESHKNEKWGHKLKKFWKSQDVFGEQVQLTFKGKRSYQTSIGALVSVIIKMILMFFITYEFYVIFARKHPIVSIKTVYDYKKLSEGMNPFERGFDVAVGLLMPAPI